MLLTSVGVYCDYLCDTVCVSMCSQYYSPPWCHLSVTAGSVSGGHCARCKGFRVLLVAVKEEEAGVRQDCSPTSPCGVTVLLGTVWSGHGW